MSGQARWGSRRAYLILLLMMSVALFPLLWMIVISLLPRGEVFQAISPVHFTLENYRAIFSDANVLLSYRNSWLISGCVVFVTLILAVPTGYGLSRHTFGLRNAYVTFLVVTQMLPLPLLAISYFRIASATGLYNTIAGLVLVDSTLSLPFAALLLRSTFDMIPRELEEVAMVDGSSRFGAFARVALPLAGSGVFAAAFFSFLLAWIDLLYGLTLTGDIIARPLTVTIADRLGHYTINWGEMMAMAFSLSIPVFIVFLIFQQVLLRGFTAGALKE